MKENTQMDLKTDKAVIEFKRFEFNSVPSVIMDNSLGLPVPRCKKK